LERRGERLVRESGLPYTIIRPGWFDYNKPGGHHLVLLQGDRRHAGDSSDGVIARGQLAELLVASLTSNQALRKTFELIATEGVVQPDLEPLFAALDADPPGWMRCATSRTCRCRKSRSGYETTWTRCGDNRGRVEAKRGGVQARRRRVRTACFEPFSPRRPSLRFSAPLIEPDVTISVIRLSDGSHVTACAAASAKEPETSSVTAKRSRVAPNNTRAGRAQNRRVVVKVLS